MTDDGKYVWASENKSPVASNPNWFKAFHLILQATDSSWKIVINGIQDGIFSANNKSFLYQSSDTLYNVILGTDKRIVLATGITNFQKVGQSGNERLICNMRKEGAVQLFDLNSNERIGYAGIKDWLISDKGDLFAVKEEMDGKSILKLIDLKNISEVTICSSKIDVIQKFTLKESHLAYIKKCKKDTFEYNEVWQYEAGSSQPRLLTTDRSLRRDSGLKILDNYIEYTQQASKLLINLQKLVKRKSKSDNIDLWRYSDARIYSVWKQDEDFSRNYLAAVNVDNGRLIRLEYENETLGTSVIEPRSNYRINDSVALIYHFNGNIFAYNRDGSLVEGFSMDEYNWNEATKCTIYLVSLQNGQRKILAKNVVSRSYTFPYYRISPTGKFVISYDQNLDQYFSYQISTGKIKNLTKGLAVSWFKGKIPHGHGTIGSYYAPWGIANFLEQDSSLFIYDHYHDIWKVGLLSNKKPENITGGLAMLYSSKLNQPIAVIMDVNNYPTPIRSGSDLMIDFSIPGQHGIGYAFDGYYKYSLKNNRLTELVKPAGQFQTDLKYFDLEKNRFLFVRNNSQTPPISYLTNDFKNYIPITSNQPDERIQDAIKKRLIIWHQTNGTICQGVLYYPKHFDTRKKYPLIVHIYEKKQVDLQYESWSSSQFYLAADSNNFHFFPDIHFNPGQTGKCALESVVSGTKFISHLPYVNTSKMGITGISFGGFETYYVISHTHLFAAAYVGFGACDFVSGYGNDDQDSEDGGSNGSIEVGQYRLGVTPWQRPDIYLANSPIIYADKITTPLLIAHYYTDTRVPFRQGVEMFKALRRLGKPVWMFASDGSPHGGDAPVGADVAFFNYYLNNGPAPNWMFGDMSEPAQMDANAKPVFSKQRGKFASGINYKHEILTPQQKELLKHRTRVNNKGFVENK